MGERLKLGSPGVRLCTLIPGRRKEHLTGWVPRGSREKGLSQKKVVEYPALISVGVII